MDPTLLVTGLLRVYLENALAANAVLTKAQTEKRPVSKEELDSLAQGVLDSRSALEVEANRQLQG